MQWPGGCLFFLPQGRGQKTKGEAHFLGWGFGNFNLLSADPRKWLIHTQNPINNIYLGPLQPRDLPCLPICFVAICKI